MKWPGGFCVALFIAVTVEHSREVFWWWWWGVWGWWIRRSPPTPLAIVCNENLPTGQIGGMNATRTFQFSAGCPSVRQGSPVLWQVRLLQIHLTSIVAHTGHPTSCGYLLNWTQFVLSILIPLPLPVSRLPPHALISRLFFFLSPSCSSRWEVIQGTEK